MNSQRQTDRDSLAALDALLRIRQSDALDSAMANNSVSSTTTNHALPLSHQSFAARWSSLAARSALMNQQNHHAGIGASPAHYRLAAAQAVAATGWGNGLLATNAPNPSTRRNSLTDTLITQSSSTPATSIHHGAAAPCTYSTTSSRSLDATGQHQEDMTASETIESTKERKKVRQEKVEEALRSKPQRGRKREDLSSKERLELTRTRNREHAKSTRIRKKARYQELLDREEKFLQIQEQENLEIERKECIQDFFEMRQSMLVDQVQKSMDNKEEPFKSARFAELADDTVSFEFDSLLPGGAKADCDDAISKMIEWDKALLTRMMETSSFGKIPAEALRSLEYELEAGPDGIAMSKNGDAFCRVELYVHDDVVPSPSKRKLVLSGICVFTFGSESRRLTSLKWTTFEDKCSIRLHRSAEGESDSSNISQPSRETLGSQLVHPSVVSLDHARHIMELDENHGPGMNI